MSDMTGQAAPVAKGSVVVGVDGSEQSLLALDRAALEAHRRGAELQILCGGVWPKRSAVPITDSDRQELLKAAAETVDAAAQRATAAFPDLRVVPSTVAEVTAADALVRATASAALTVVGTRGHGGFAGLLLGSVSLKVAAHCQGPLMVVREDHPGKAEAARGSVLVGYSNEEDREALRFAFEEASRSDRTLRVVHTLAAPRMPGRLQQPKHELAEADERGRRMVREAVAPLVERYPDVTVRGDVETGTPSAVLIEASRSADCVVLTSRRVPRKLGLNIGTTLHALLHHAHCPVVAVPDAR